LVKRQQNVQVVAVMALVVGGYANFTVRVTAFDQGHEVTVRGNIIAETEQRQCKDITGGLDAFALRPAYFPTKVFTH
jgi:hypothetical protein